MGASIERGPARNSVELGQTTNLSYLEMAMLCFALSLHLAPPRSIELPASVCRCSDAGHSRDAVIVSRMEAGEMLVVVGDDHGNGDPVGLSG